jgi:hypothetical protein
MDCLLFVDVVWSIPLPKKKVKFRKAAVPDLWGGTGCAVPGSSHIPGIFGASYEKSIKTRWRS